MRLLLLLLIVCLVAPSFEWRRRRRRRRWIRIRVPRIVKGAIVAAKVAPLIGKRDDLPLEDVEQNIDRSELDGIFSARDAEALKQLEEEYNES